MKTALSISFLCLMVTTNAFCSMSPECDKLFSYFYVNSSPEAFVELQNCVDKNESELRGPENHVENIVATMIAVISERHNWPIISVHFGKKAKNIVTGKSSLAKYIANESKVDAKKLDLWWAGFSGTGDLNYVEKIYRLAGEGFENSNMKEMMTIGAASWSFKANCNQHEKVRKFAEAKLQKGGLSKNKEKYLQDCIKQALE